MVKKLIYIFGVCIIIIYSFFTLSPNFNPEFNSDGAVTVLMTYDFNLPHDLYFWGQNRAGSLIPLFGQVFYRLFDLRPITAVSLSYYFFLILGFLSFLQLFKNYFSKIIFCIAWFLPFFLFNDLIWYTIGLQYCLIGISIFLLNKIQEPFIKKTHWKNLLILLILSFVFLISFWVSDLSIISILILIVIFSWFELRKYILKVKYIYILFLILGAAFSLWITSYFKKYSITKTLHYESINNFKESLAAIKIIFKSIYNYLSFNSNDTILTLSVYCIFIVIICIFYYIVRRKFNINKNISKWLIFFTCDIIIIFSTLIFSHWVYLNDVARRYFVSTYISSTIFILIFIEYLTIKKKHVINLQILIILTVVICALSNEYHFKYVAPKTTKPIIETVGEFKTLGNIGLIAGYWKAYISSAADPEFIKATPHDKDEVRNYELVSKVFSQPNIYVIRDQWMDYFPDTLNQFGYVLLKDGNQILIANCMICRYKILKNNN